MPPEPAAKVPRVFPRSRSIAITVLSGLLITGLLFAAISIISLLGFFGFQESLSRLSRHTFPQATTTAQISILLNELLHQTAVLHDAASQPERRTAYLDIEQQFARVDDFSRNGQQDDGDGPGPKIEILKKIVRDLNDLVQERITAQAQLQEALGRLLPLAAWSRQQGTAALSTAAEREKAAVEAVLDEATELLEIAHDAASARSLQVLRENEKALLHRLLALTSTAERLTAQPAAAITAIGQRLQEELFAPLGLLPKAIRYHRLVNDSRNKAVFAESLVREKEEAHIGGFFDLTSSVGQENQLLAAKVRTQIAVLTTLFLSSMILALTFFFYFRRVLIARLQKLNRQVLAMVSGEQVPVTVEGGDEISEIARSVNYFAGEMRQAKEAAEQAAVAKAEFLAHMSHEIRTPMNAILGFSELALNSGNPEEHRDSLAKINTASHTLLGIVNTVLDYSKIEAGKFTIDHAPFDLRRLLENLATLVSLRCEESGLEFYCQIAPDTPYALRGDGLRLGQVLTNLITNAFKFTERGSVTLHIAGEREDDERVRLHFAVHDTGQGIAEEELDKLFQPFSQADTSMTRRQGGTGLGLAICKRLVEMMHGEIGYARGEEGGSIFRFSLPLLLEGDSGHTFFSAPKTLSGKRVLVMSEVARTASELACQLQAFGCLVVQALSPEEVRASLAASGEGERCHVLILDGTPSGLGGDEILALAERESHGVPVLVTGPRAFLSRHQPLPARCTFLAKPILPERLLQALLATLGLAAAPQPAEPSPHGGLAAMRQQLLGHKVLLVEDNEINRQVALGFLRAVGLSITTAANGAEALDILQQSHPTPFELVLMDLQMPVMDGYSATQAIRKLPPPTSTLPILALTAHAMPEEREKCLRLGMVDLLAKPIDPATLYDKLRALLDHRPAPPSTAEKPGPPLPLHARHDRSEESPAIDLAAGRQRVMGDDQLYRLLLQTFIDTYGGWWRELRRELAAGRLGELGDQAHTLKGACGNLGMTRLQEQSARLEQVAKQGDKEACLALIADIEAETISLCAFLEGYLAEQGEEERAELLSR